MREWQFSYALQVKYFDIQEPETIACQLMVNPCRKWLGYKFQLSCTKLDRYLPDAR